MGLVKAANSDQETYREYYSRLMECFNTHDGMNCPDALTHRDGHRFPLTCVREHTAHALCNGIQLCNESRDSLLNLPESTLASWSMETCTIRTDIAAGEVRQ